MDFQKIVLLQLQWYTAEGRSLFRKNMPFYECGVVYMKILVISDIHGNFPALQAVVEHIRPADCDLICNCGDSTVYAPFPNETLDWLQHHQAISILGNTDRKILKLARGKSFKKPGKPEKRIMYTSTFAELKNSNINYLQGLSKKKIIPAGKIKIGLFHGSPADPDEFLFPDTPEDRFQELVHKAKQDIICIGHSHTPFYKRVQGVHFINPGSVGRMFDGNPAASCAVIEIDKKTVTVSHYRVPWNIQKTVKALRKNNLPEIYTRMYEQGRKLN